MSYASLHYSKLKRSRKKKSLNYLSPSEAATADWDELKNSKRRSDSTNAMILARTMLLAFGFWIEDKDELIHKLRAYSPDRHYRRVSSKK